MNYFPNGDEEKELVRFIARYQCLKVSDAKRFFVSYKYYRSRIKSLIDKKILRKIKWYLVLGDFGIEYAKELGFEYNKLNRNKQYMQRVMRISNLAAYYHNCKTVKFTPSFSMKDRECYTFTGRRYIGVFNISRIKYLTYYISEDRDKRYIASIAFDIEKEMEYKNFIIFVNDINRINLEDFAVGKNSVLIIEDNEENREKLKYLHRINWSRVLKDYFKEEIAIASYMFCDYTDYINKYISTFYFVDAQKIIVIKHFLDVNEEKAESTIICRKELESILRMMLPNGNYVSIDLDKYINKERRIWMEEENGGCYPEEWNIMKFFK